jgi:hypothetical protein
VLIQREKTFLIIRPQQTIPRIKSADLVTNLIVVISEPFTNMLGLLDFSILSFTSSRLNSYDLLAYIRGVEEAVELGVAGDVRRDGKREWHYDC